jgi:hypothetical protein
MIIDGQYNFRDSRLSLAVPLVSSEVSRSISSAELTLTPSEPAGGILGHSCLQAESEP